MKEYATLLAFQANCFNQAKHVIYIGIYLTDNVIFLTLRGIDRWSVLGKCKFMKKKSIKQKAVV